MQASWLTHHQAVALPGQIHRHTNLIDLSKTTCAGLPMDTIGQSHSQPTQGQGLYQHATQDSSRYSRPSKTVGQGGCMDGEACIYEV